MNHILNQHSIGKNNQHLVGNKAWRLAELNRQGFATADFFVIANTLNKLDIHHKTRVVNEIKTLKATSFAVRSSANCEDGVDASFAGQFESYLSLTKKDVIPAVIQCWASAKRDSVGDYCKYNNINPCHIKMAVIVQSMVKADKGGVIFTKNVFEGRDQIIVEAASGLGEKVVSGSHDSQKYVVNKKTRNLVESVVGNSPQILSKNELDRLVKLALEIEHNFGSPQDIEWAYQNGQLFILQTRPIT